MDLETTVMPPEPGHKSFRNIKIVVAVPTLNEERTIEAVLKTLASEKEDLPNLQIVVADGGSVDQTVAIARSVGESLPFIDVIDNPRRFQSAAINLVAQQWKERADILVRCDAHAHYPAGFITDLLKSMLRTGADSVVVPMDSVGRDCIERSVAWISDTPFGSGGSAHRGGRQSGFVDHGHHAAFNLASFLRNGGYDETFSHNEDAELDCRLNANGGRVFLDADTRLKYHPRNSFSRLWRQYFNYGRGRSRTIRRHPHTIRLRQIVVPAHFILTVLSVILTLAVGHWWLLAWPVVYVAALTAVSVKLALTHNSVCGLLAGLAAAVMHFSWASGFFWGLLTVRERRWTGGIVG